MTTTQSATASAPSSAPVTLNGLLLMPQAELDDLFRSRGHPEGTRGAGRMPDGDSQGVGIVGKGSFWRRWWANFVRKHLWQGKVFRRENDDNATLVNKVTRIGVEAIQARIYRGKSWFDDQECIVLDYSKTSFIAKKIRDEIREVSPGVYLGLVYWGKNTKRLLNFALDFNQHPPIKA